MPRHPDPVTVGVPIGAHQEEERKTAGRDHMLTMRALTKPKVRTDIA